MQDNKYKFSFVFQAGQIRQFEPDNPMLINGDYKVIVTYQPPSIGTPKRELVELHFNYNNSADANTITNNSTSAVIAQSEQPKGQEQDRSGITLYENATGRIVNGSMRVIFDYNVTSGEH